MKGGIHLRKDVRYPWWYIQWWDNITKKLRPVTKYRGERMYQTHPKKQKDTGCLRAEKLLAQMQGDVENNVFRIEKYLDTQWTDVIEFYEKWLDKKIKKTPATYKGYKSYFNCHFRPFFTEHRVMLHEITAGTIEDLMDYLVNIKTKGTEKETPLSGKMKYNIMNCFHHFLDYARRHNRIIAIPPFPKKEDYEIIDPIIEWLPEERQMAVIYMIPEVHRPIFLFLKYHYRRPAEACALHKIDYDPINEAFTIRRSISARKLIHQTKTKKQHLISCDIEFVDIANRLLNESFDSPFLFANPLARKDGKRYTNESLNIIWKEARKKAGEDIDLYSGLKHSSCSQYINERDGSLDDLQTLTEHARRDSVLKYAAISLRKKRNLMNKGKKVVPFKKISGEK